MEKKVNVKCTVVFGNKDFKKIYTEYIKTKIKEQKIDEGIMVDSTILL